MDYQRIKYFLKAAETLNFTTAARECFITPQAFGRQIKTLEQELGFSLFERSTRKTALTLNGKICYQHFSTTINNLETEFHKMCEMGESRKKTINVGFFSPLSKESIITPVFINLIHSFPGYEINVSILELDQLAERINNLTLDLALMAINDEDTYWADYEKIRLKAYKPKLAVSLYHKWVMKEKITAEDMKLCEFIQLSTPDYSNRFFENMPCKRRVVAANYDSAQMLLKQGKAFTIFAEDMDDMPANQIKVFDIDDIYTSNFWLTLICNKDNKREFVDEVIERIKDVFEDSATE